MTTFTNTTPPVDVCQAVLDIAKKTPDAFTMGEWLIPTNNEECPTTGCIAGWVGEFFGDRYADLPRLDDGNLLAEVEEAWQQRQAARLGFDWDAAQMIFFEDVDRVAEIALERCVEYLRHNGDGSDTVPWGYMSDMLREADIAVEDEEELAEKLA